MVRRIGRDPEMPAGQGLLADQRRPPLIQGEQPRGDAVNTSRFGRRASWNSAARRLLERRHLARQVGLAQARGAGGGGEGAGLGHEMEGAELAWRHIHETDS